MQLKLLVSPPLAKNLSSLAPLGMPFHGVVSQGWFVNWGNCSDSGKLWKNGSHPLSTRLFRTGHSACCVHRCVRGGCLRRIRKQLQGMRDNVHYLFCKLSWIRRLICCCIYKLVGNITFTRIRLMFMIARALCLKLTHLRQRTKERIISFPSGTLGTSFEVVEGCHFQQGLKPRCCPKQAAGRILDGPWNSQLIALLHEVT